MRKFFKHPALILAVTGALTLFFALQIPKIQIDNNNIRFVPEDDEARLTSAYIDETFESSLFILVGLERKYGTVFDREFLSILGEYARRVEELEIVGTVDSLMSSDYISGDGDMILVEKLIPGDFTGSPVEIEALKQRLLSWDLYERSLISDDFTATQVLIPLDIPAEDAGRPSVTADFTQIRDMAWEMFDGVADVYVTGLPVFSSTINEAVRADLSLLVPLVVAVVLAVLFFSFRRFTAVTLPLLTVAIAVIWSVGAMPLFGVKLSVISTVLPVILVAVGSAYGIHVVTHYLEDRGNVPLTAEEHRELIFKMLSVIGKPVFLAAFTTFAGFISFAFTRVLPIREFGIFAAFGVAVSFAAAVTLIPSLLLIRGPKPFRDFAVKKPKEKTGSQDSPSSDGSLPEIFSAIARKKRTVLCCAVAAILVSVYGVNKIVIDNILVEYFKSDTDISKSDRFIREKFGGSKAISIVVEAESSEILLHPDSLLALDGLSRFLDLHVPEVGKTMGFTDLIKRINQVFNADESPEGITRAAVSPVPADDFSFGGFGDDASFSFDFSGGDMSFDFGESSGGDAWDGGFEEAAPEGPEAGGQVYTAAELAALLEKAAMSGDRWSLDGGELVWQIKRLVNYGGAAYYEIPGDPARYGKTTREELQGLISNYLMLISGSSGSYANDSLEPTAIKATVLLNIVGWKDGQRAIDAINGYVAANFPKNLRVLVGGAAMVEASLNDLVVQSQLISVGLSLLLVFIIVSFSNRSAMAGLIGIVPLSISILINFAVMGFLGIKLNIGTSMVASVSVGIGIDYTIHYMEAFRREYLASGGKGNFLSRTFATSGKAIIINALSVGAGFAVLLFSQFIMMKHLGLLIALTMVTSALVSLTVIPVLLTMLKPRFIYGDIRVS